MTCEFRISDSICVDEPIAMTKEEEIATHSAAKVAVDPERGLLASCREWVDLLPWFRLFRVMRLLGSPVLVSLTLFVLLIWYQGASWILEGEFRQQIRSGHAGVGLKETSQVFSQIGRLGYKLHPASMMQFADRIFSPRWLAASLWTVLIWLVPGLFLIRQGVMLTVGRELESLFGWRSIAWRRSWPAFCSIVGVLLAPLAIALSLWLVHAISRLLPNYLLFQLPLGFAVASLAVLGGLLLLSSYFAMPLSIASIVTEPSPDAIDAISRGYESCFRRPLRMLGYLAVVVVLLLIAFLVASGIVSCANGLLFVATGSDWFRWSSLQGAVLMVLSVFPTAIITTLAWGLIGGVYLLLRKDTCEHEIEDVWVPTLDDSIVLKELSELPELNVNDDEGSQ